MYRKLFPKRYLFFSLVIHLVRMHEDAFKFRNIKLFSPTYTILVSYFARGCHKWEK